MNIVQKRVKFLSLVTSLLLVLFALSACAPQASVAKTDGISIVSTIFPSYDFARQITAGTNANVTMLLQPGEEVHSFDPTSQDIIRVQNADLFLYVGGENDTWVENVLSGLDKSVHTFKMMDYVTLYEEETGRRHAARSGSTAGGRCGGSNRVGRARLDRAGQRHCNCQGHDERACRP